MKGTASIVAAILLTFCASGAWAQSEVTLYWQGTKLIHDFMGRLVGELRQGVKQNGPVETIAVCKQKAPAIAAELGGQSGWKVGRTSLRVRNPLNAPDPWERRVLEDFQRRAAAGEKVKGMEYSEVVEQDGHRVYRLMKAIPTGGVCLLCHGQRVAPKVRKKINDLYPEDQATGFAPGQLRGAFTLQKQM